MLTRVCSVLALLAVSCSDSPGGTAVTAQDWPMYGLNLQHTFSQPQTSINAGNAMSLVQKWTFPTADAVSASPSVVAGVVYVGSWDGYFYALDLATGALRWKFQVDCQNTILPIPAQCLAPGQTPPDRTATDGGLITGSATVLGGRVYFGGGRTMYCLDAQSGALVWKRVVCGKPEAPGCETDANDPAQIFSSPAVFDGKVMFGVTTDGADGYRGGIVALDAQSGAPLWRFEVDPILDGNGNPMVDGNGNVVGGMNRGCGSVWASGAIDDHARLIFFGTGDCQSAAPPPYHEAVLALSIDTGKPQWVFRPRTNDTCDFDFGASANLIDLQGSRYLGVGGKDGTYYLLDAQSGQLKWSRNVVFGGSSGGFIGTTAFDGQHIYGATGIGELGSPMVCNPSDPRDTQVQDPSMHAIGIADGAVAWEKPMGYSFAPTTVANGVLFSGVGNTLPAALFVYDAATGRKLGKFDADGAVNSGVSIVGSTIVFGSGNSYDGGGGAVHALQLH